MRMLGMDMCGMLVDSPSGKQGTHTWQLHNNPWLALDHLKRRLLYDGSITIASDPMTLFNVSPLDYVFGQGTPRLHYTLVIRSEVAVNHNNTLDAESSRDQLRVDVTHTFECKV